MVPKDVRLVTALLLAVSVVFNIGSVKSDFAEDRNECGNQLIGLAPCLSYVGGDATAPSAACCTTLRENVNYTKRYCLCVLVKDRNDPNLGFKVNATLALTLPSICHASSVNASECPALLHLAPGSPDAQVFEQFAGASTNSTSAVAAGIPGSTSSSYELKKRWLPGGILGGIIISALVVGV